MLQAGSDFFQANESRQNERKVVPRVCHPVQDYKVLQNSIVIDFTIKGQPKPLILTANRMEKFGDRGRAR